MKPWQKIVALGLTTLLMLVFYAGYQIYKFADSLAKGLTKEGFQATTQDPFNPGRETAAERRAFDEFEANNTLALQQNPPSAVPKFDTAVALAEFDENAPIPWDQDNKYDDPKDILWGYVDSRCSREIWDRARLEALFNTANNIDIVPESGELSYWSSKLDGRIFHDPATINAVKFAEFLLDFAYEEIIEDAIDRIEHAIFSDTMQATGRAEIEAKAAVKLADTQAKTAGKPMTRAERTALYDAEFNKSYGNALRDLQISQAQATKATTGGSIRRAISKIDFMGRIASGTVRGAAGLVYKGIGKAFQLTKGAGQAITGRLTKAFSPGTPLKRTLSPAVARSIGFRKMGASLAKLAGRRAAALIRNIAKMLVGTAAFAAIPVVGQMLAAISLVLNIAFLAVIPQVLSILADLDENPLSDNCDDTFQGCPQTHPFNLRCAIIEATGTGFYEFLIAVPFIGDAIGSMAPYLCSRSENGIVSTTFRQSFRPPPYYFDTTLSLFYTEKQKILDGGYENDIAGADEMYKKPETYKLKLMNPDGSREWDTFYHPWVDYSHTEMLNAMADFYYDMAKRYQTITIDGKAYFEYISMFRGIIASSQYSCDVQVELKRLTLDPITGAVYSDEPVDNPVDTGEIFQTGCTFHDRRFYFTVDFTKAFPETDYSAKSPEELTRTVKERIQGISDGAQRLQIYRKMFRVVGCTNTNGTAPNVINYTADGDFVGDAPVAIGTPGNTYRLPMKFIADPNLRNRVPNDETCNNIRSNINTYGVNNLGGAQAQQGSRANVDQYTIGLSQTYTPPGTLTATSLDQCRTSYSTAAYKGHKCSIAGTDYIFWNAFGTLPSATDSLSDYSWVQYKPAPDGAVTLSQENLYTPGLRSDYTPPSPDLYGRTLDAIKTPAFSTSAYFGIRCVINSTFQDPPSRSYSNLLQILIEQAKLSTDPSVSQTLKSQLANTSMYIYWRKDGALPNSSDSAADYAWVPYRPKPVWPRYTETWLQGTTKSWEVQIIKKSEKEKWIAGLTGAAIGLLPLGFGFTGALFATTLDVTGANNAMACLYQDVRKQGGTFVINGMTATSEDHFFITRGPAIQYAPGYAPTLTKKCQTLQINQRICSNRSNIRRLAKRFNFENGGTRRIKRVTAILPDPANDQCIYTVQDTAVDTNTKLDIPQTETNFNYVVQYEIANTNTCTYTPRYPVINRNPTFQSPPMPYKSSDFQPPMTRSEFDALPATVYPFFLRGGCDTNLYKDCSKPAIQAKLIEEFNKQYLLAASEPTLGSVVKLTSITAAKTPNPAAVAASNPVCVFDARYERMRNGTVTTESAIIKMTVTPNVEDRCLYSIDSHDFPQNYFLMPVPKPGTWLELPPAAAATTSILRPSCTDAAVASWKGVDATKAATLKTNYADCSGQEIIDRLVRAYNKQSGRQEKILRVVKANTPLMADGSKVCDYEVDIVRKSKEPVTTNQKYFLERDTVRLNLTPATDNQCLYDIDWSKDQTTNRQTGTTIDRNSDLQSLVTDYIWSSSYLQSVRNVLNTAIASFTTLDIPNSLKTATQDVKGRVQVLAKSLQAGQNIAGCETTTPPITAKSPDLLNAFINRYNFDNYNLAGEYPAGQFGTTRNSIIAIRRAGLAGPTECHVELIERRETFQNAMKKPNPTNLTVVDLNRRTFLRQYRFFVENSAAGPDGKCSFTIPKFTAIDIAKRSFDISGEATGITDPNTAITPDQGVGISFNSPTVNPWSIPVLNTVRAATNAFKGPATGFLSQVLEKIVAAAVVRPNIVEYSAFVTERFSDPDYGQAAYNGEEVILVVSWDESRWDPVKGAFIGGTTTAAPPPTSFVCYNVGRATIVAKTKVNFDGVIVDSPPYLFLPLDLDPTTEASIVIYPRENQPTSELVVSTTSPSTWALRPTGTSALENYS